MLGKLGARSGDMAIDLGTANTLVYVKGRDIVVNEPSVVAIAKTGSSLKVLSVGAEANRMIGRTPENVRAIRPMRNGVIGDFDVAQEMITYFIKQAALRRSRLTGPRMIVSIPCSATAVEQRATREAAAAAGARHVFLIEEPMAAAFGADLPVTEATGSMVVDIGGGTTGIAVLSLGGIVDSENVRVGGYDMDEAISAYIRRAHNVAIGEATAELIKIEIGSACRPTDGDGLIMEVKGLDLVHGIPKIFHITEREVADALAESVGAIIEGTQSMLERTKPELSADIVDKGIILTGGGALLGNLAKVLRNATGLPVSVAEDPLTCVARGSGRVLEQLDKLKNLLQD